MGLAWFDDEAPAMDEPAVRTGGLPLLPAGAHWPCCPTCGQPMLFRAQVPLSLTSIVSFDDPRLLVAFECHAQTDDGPCDAGAAMLVDGDHAEPLRPPASASADVVLQELGPRPAEVLRIVTVIDDAHWIGGRSLPRTILRSAPPSIARETVRAIEEAGGTAAARKSAPTTLGVVHGGRLVPFDDGPRAMYRTTLPPLDRLVAEMGRAAMRALLGGSLPGYRDHSSTCTCGRPTRTAVRFLPHREADPETGVLLGAAVAQVCVRCDMATLHRTTARPRVTTGVRPSAW